MEMKWHPIINGDLSGIPINEEFLFTVFDEIDDKTYVIKGLVTNGWPGSNPYKVLETTVRGCRYHNSKKVKAWMELPSPFHPNDCNKCAYWNEWKDEFGDGNAECELDKNVPFTKIKPGECRLNR